MNIWVTQGKKREILATALLGNHPSVLHFLRSRLPTFRALALLGPLFRVPPSWLPLPSSSRLLPLPLPPFSPDPIKLRICPSRTSR